MDGVLSGAESTVRFHVSSVTRQVPIQLPRQFTPPPEPGSPELTKRQVNSR